MAVPVSGTGVRYPFVMLPNPWRDLLSRFRATAVALALPAALLVAPVAVADPGGADLVVAPVSDQALPCCAENLPAPEELPAPAPEEMPAPAPVELPPAGEAAHVHVDAAPRLLPPGPVSEQGLQVKTILVARAVSAAFPQIRSMIGVRPDPKPWHPSGRAIDFMIPNAGSAEGIALGDAILDFAMRNADRFGIQDVIWRGVYHTPAGPGGSGYGHYDHVHITTIGGGYPSGGEEYFAAA